MLVISYYYLPAEEKNLQNIQKTTESYKVSDIAKVFKRLAELRKLGFEAFVDSWDG